MSTLDVMMPPARMLSETDSYTPVSLDKVNDLIALGGFPTEPVALENGIFYFQRGAYAYFRYKNGTRVCLYAPNPDDLALEDVVLRDHPDLTSDDNLVRHSSADPWQRAPDGKILPRRPKDLGNGNLNRLWVFAPGQEDASEKDAMQEMRAHQGIWQDMTIRYGYSKPLSPDLRLSKGLIYEFLPEDHNDPRPEALGDLVITPAPHGGWRMDHNYKMLFQHKGWPLGPLNAVFMRAASLRAKNITRAQADQISKADFEKRSQAFLWRENPYDFPLKPAIKGKSGLKNKYLRSIRAAMHKNWWSEMPLMATRLKPFTRLKRAAASAYYGLRQYNRVEWGKSALFTVLVNMPFILFDILSGTILNPFVLGGRMASQSAGKSGQRIMEYSRQQNIVYRRRDMHAVMEELTCEWNETQFLGGRFKPSMAIDLQGMTNEELKLDSLGQDEIHQTLSRRQAALSYIMSTQCAAYGSHVNYFKCGKLEGLRIDESSGLSVEYIPSANLCFARMDWTRLDRTILPGFVVDLFIKGGMKDPYLMVRYDRAKRRLSCEFLSEARYTQEWNNAGAHKERESRAAHIYVEKYRPKPKTEYTDRALSRRFTKSVRKAVNGATELVDNTVEKFFDVLKP